MMPDHPPVDLLAVSSPATVAAHEDSTRKWARYQKAKYWAIGLGVCVIVALVVVVTILVALVYAGNEKLTKQSGQLVVLAKQNHDNLAATQQAVGILVDCTTPGHKCYEQGQQATRTAVEGLNAAANARELCAHDLNNDTVDKLTACVIRTLSGTPP